MVDTSSLILRTIGFRVDKYDRSLPLIIDPSSDLIYSTFLGGSDLDQAWSMAIDSSGCAYVTGSTSSSDFPTTTGAYTAAYSRGDVFVAKMNPSGSALVYSAIIGPGLPHNIAVDSSGCAYVAGEAYTDDFPITTGAFKASLKRGIVQRLRSKTQLIRQQPCLLNFHRRRLCALHRCRYIWFRVRIRIYIINRFPNEHGRVRHYL